MEKGFVENIKKEERYLTALAFKLSSSRDDALDLIQETWLRIMENYHNYDNRNKFRSWASVIMKKIFINNFRNKKRHGITVDIEDARMCASEDKDPDMIVKYVMRSVSEMPHEMSAVFYLYLQGYTYEEIAQRVSIPLGTVKSRIHSIKKRLQAILEPLI